MKGSKKRPKNDAGLAFHRIAASPPTGLHEIFRIQFSGLDQLHQGPLLEGSGPGWRPSIQNFRWRKRLGFTGEGHPGIPKKKLSLSLVNHWLFIPVKLRGVFCHFLASQPQTWMNVKGTLCPPYNSTNAFWIVKVSGLLL